MKISWMKYAKDTKSFKIPQALGLDVFQLEDPEETDNKINELIKQNYKTIILTNEIAGFSQDIIKKYQKDKEIKLIIASPKE